MSFTPFKEVSTANAGSATRYGSDDLLELMKIFNAKTVTGRRPEIVNPWRFSSSFELKQIAEASVATPTDANVVKLFLSAADNKVKVKKTGGLIVNLEDIGSGTWSNTTTETFSNKTINIDTSTIKHSTTNFVADILRFDGVRYNRMAKGTANQVLATNAAGTDLEWQTPVGGGGGGGEANTASSIGTAGIGLFQQKLGVDLQFKNLFSPDATINISDDPGNAKIDITLGTGTVKTTAANVFGDFQQSFRSGKLALTNPANTFTYQLTGGAIAANRAVSLPVITVDDSFVLTNATQNVTAKTITGSTMNTDSNTIKHSTTNTAGELLVNTGAKYDRKAKGAADSFLKVNSAGTDIEWGVPGSLGGVKLPDGTVASTTGRWGAFFGGCVDGFGMMSFTSDYARRDGSAQSSTESTTNIYTEATTSTFAEYKTITAFRRDSTCIFKAKWNLKSASSGIVMVGLSSGTSLPVGTGTGSPSTVYDITQDGGHLEFDSGFTRHGVKFLSGGSGIGKIVTEVTFRGRAYGSPTGNVTCSIRKASGDTQSVLGTFSASGLSTSESTRVIDASANTYVMVANDIVCFEFPLNATNGVECDQSDTASAPSGYSSVSYDGSWNTSPGGTKIGMKVVVSAQASAGGNTPLNGTSGLLVHGTIGTHTNYQIARNDGSTTQTAVDSGKALANTTDHTIEININSTNCAITLDGTAFTYTTIIPATTTPLAWYFHLETATAVERGLGIVYAQVVMTS